MTRQPPTPFPFAQAVRSRIGNRLHWRSSKGTASTTYAFARVGELIKAEMSETVEAQFWVARQESGAPRVSFEFFPASKKHANLNQALASDLREFLRSQAAHTFQDFHESTGYTVLHARVNIRGNESEIPEAELNKALDLFNFVQQHIGHWCEERLPGLLRRIKGSVDALDDLAECRSSYEDLPETEQLEIRKSRIGQGRFRTDLILYWDRKCAVTGVTEIPILRASHIKPWRDSDNRERLDKYNGLLLAPNLDALFDAGRIAFDDDGRMLISADLSSEDRRRLGVEERMELRRIEQGHRENLRFHRGRFGFE